MGNITAADVFSYKELVLKAFITLIYETLHTSKRTMDNDDIRYSIVYEVLAARKSKQTDVKWLLLDFRTIGNLVSGNLYNKIH